ncbi:hypothetical protein [Enterococcus thailandicus]|uniref:Uncharacterized protein n=1 Tax=Enterococcus thailandicus TaxID=417368 RepID=A0A179EV39_ENTTH|nr:hypothetical protein [Enterococcus thailandicus]OAQ57081.1 hypothetical protein A6E74_01520 [Enterococcus thailandicus]
MANEMINEMFDVYIKSMKQEDEESGKKIEATFDALFDMMSEEEQTKCKKEAIVGLLQVL